MLLEFVISQAKSGELSQMSAQHVTDRKIVGYINLAMVELYKRFQLETDEFIVSLQDGKTIYLLDGTDTDVTKGNDVNGDPIYLETAYNEVMYPMYAYEENGIPININDTTDPLSILTPTYNTIQIPVVDSLGSFVSVIYNKNPKLVTTEVTYSGDDIIGYNSTTIGIPLQLLEPLLYYIGYRAHGSRDGNINAENNTHLMRFEAACKEAANLGVMPNADIGIRDIRLKGYV